MKAKMVSKLCKKVITPFYGKGLALVLFMFLFYTIPEVYVRLKHTKKEILEKAQLLAKDQVLAYSYDGIELSAWGGIWLENLKVSAESDFQRGRFFLAVPRVIVNLQWPSLFQGEFRVSEVVFDGGEINFYFDEENTEKLFWEDISRFLKKISNVKIRFRDMRLNLYFRQKPYEKEQWYVEHIDGYAENQKGFLLDFHYQSDTFGKGKVHFLFEENFLEQGTLLIKEISVQFQNFPLFKMAWFLGKNFIMQGEASGQYRRTTEKGKLRHQRLIADLNDFLLNYESNIPFGPLSLHAELEHEKDSKEERFSLNLETKEILAKLAGKLSASFIPDSLFVEITPKKGELLLPLGYKLSGLQKFYLDWRYADGKYKPLLDFEILQGSIYSANGEILRLPRLTIALKEAEFKAELELKAKWAQIALYATGGIHPITRDFRAMAYPLLTGYAKETQRILAWKSKIQGDLFLEELNVEEVFKSATPLMEKYNQILVTGLQQSYAPSRFRDREFFVRFLENLYLDLNLKFLKLYFSKNDKKDFLGSFKVSPTIMELKLYHSHDDFLELQYSYASNIPYLSAKVKFFFHDLEDKAIFWRDTNLLDKFSALHLNYTFFASGERLSELYLSHRGHGDFLFYDVHLGHEARKRDLVTRWDELKVRLERQGSIIYIKNFEAKNKNFELRGQGEIRESNVKRSYSFTYKLSQSS